MQAERPMMPPRWGLGRWRTIGYKDYAPNGAAASGYFHLTQMAGYLGETDCSFLACFKILDPGHYFARGIPFEFHRVGRLELLGALELFVRLGRRQGIIHRQTHRPQFVNRL